MAVQLSYLADDPSTKEVKVLKGQAGLTAQWKVGLAPL
jgi:hypothetical protein